VLGKFLQRCDKGTAAIEFALIVPLFLLITIGGFNLAWSLERIQNVEFAMSLAARALELSPTTTQSQLQTIVRNNLQFDDKNAVTLTLVVDPADSGTKLAHATVNYALSIWIPLLGTYSMTRSSAITVPLAVL
jgi:Flp pilus assembly protein TadG